jgi:hypothetical protein
MEEQLTIGEAIYPFRCRRFFRVYIKGKPHKYWIKMYELYQAKSSYICNLEICTVAHPTNSEHNTAFSVVDRLCDKREGSLRTWMDGSPVQRSTTIYGVAKQRL